MIDIITFALATWRLSSFLSNEQGPASIFEKLRKLVGVEYNQAGEQFGTNWIADDLTCQWCCTIYAGIFWTVLYKLFPKVSRWIAYPFVLSTIAIMIMTSKGIQVYLRNLNK